MKSVVCRSNLPKEIGVRKSVGIKVAEAKWHRQEYLSRRLVSHGIWRRGSKDRICQCAFSIELGEKPGSPGCRCVCLLGHAHSGQGGAASLTKPEDAIINIKTTLL